MEIKRKRKVHTEHTAVVLSYVSVSPLWRSLVTYDIQTDIFNRTVLVQPLAQWCDKYCTQTVRYNGVDLYRKSHKRECNSEFMGTNDALKVLKIARAVGECNLRSFKAS